MPKFVERLSCLGFWQASQEFYESRGRTLKPFESDSFGPIPPESFFISVKRCQEDIVTRGLVCIDSCLGLMQLALRAADDIAESVAGSP